MEKIFKNPWFLIFIILVIAAFLRLYQITQLPPGFYPDEAMDANNGVEAWTTDHFQFFYPENNGREGLWSNIIGFFIFKIGHEPWVPRSVAAIFGILTVLGIYFLAKELFAEKIALLSSFLIATSFWQINFSRIGFRAILAPFFLIWAIYFLLKSLNKTDDKNKVHLIILSLLGGIFYGLGFYTYIAYRITPLLILLTFFFYWKKSKLTTCDVVNSFIIFLITTFVVAAPLGFYFLKNPQDFFSRSSQISVFSSPTPLKDLGINILKTAGMFNFVGDSNWRHNYPGQPELFWPVGILFLIGLILSFKSHSLKIENWKLKIPLAWLAFAALPVIISNEGMPHALRALLMAPPVFIFAGAGGIWLYEFIISKAKNRKLFNAFVFIFLSLLVFQAYFAYFILWGQNPNVTGAFTQNYVAIGRQLNALPKNLPKYVVVKAGGVLVRGLPMPAQTVMFITDTFEATKQKEKNIFYILPNQTNQIPAGSYVINLE